MSVGEKERGRGVGELDLPSPLLPPSLPSASPASSTEENIEIFSPVFERVGGVSIRVVDSEGWMNRRTVSLEWKREGRERGRTRLSTRSCQEASASEEDIFKIQVPKDGWREKGGRRGEEKREGGRMEKKGEEEREWLLGGGSKVRGSSEVEKLLFSRAFEHYIDEVFSSSQENKKS